MMRNTFLPLAFFLLIGFVTLLCVSCEKNKDTVDTTRISKIVQYDPASDPADPDTLRTYTFEYYNSLIRKIIVYIPSASVTGSISFGYMGPLLTSVKSGLTADSLTYNLEGQVVEYSSPHMFLAYSDYGLLSTFTAGTLIYTFDYDFNANITQMNKNEGNCQTTLYSYDDMINPIHQLKIPPRIIIYPCLSDFNFVLSRNNTTLITETGNCQAPVGYVYEYDSGEFPLKRFQVNYIEVSADPISYAPADTVLESEYFYD
jgi:hypothetical protein